MYKSRVYSNTIARYLEGRLITDEKLRRLIDSDFSDAVKILADFGWGGGTVNENSFDVDKLITAERKILLEFVEEDCPSEELKDILTNKYRYSDAKVYYKARLSKSDLKSALYIGDDKLEAAIDGKNYAELPAFLADALVELDALSDSNKLRPRDIDIYITRAMEKDNLYRAKKSRDKMLIGYVTTEIDFFNILTAFRVKKLGGTKELLLGELLDGGSVSEELLIGILTMTNENISREFSGTVYSESVDALLSSDSLASFERDTDEALYNLMAASGNNMQSLGPFINYFIAKNSEFKTVKTVLVLIKNNARGEISKRIRSSYD